MQLTSENDVESEKERQEVRSKLKDDKFIQKQLSLLKSPGIENSEERFQVHQFTRSAMLLPDFNDFARIQPLVDGLISELNPSDFLGCSAAMEILAEIAASKKENIRYFEQIGLLNTVYDLFKFTKSNPDLGIPHIACIRFFGYLSTADHQSLTKFPLFTEDVFDAVNRFDAFDLVRRKLAFETLAIVTTTSGAKQFLSSENCPHSMAKAMNHLGAAVATGSGLPDLKAVYLDCVRTIFDSFDPESPVESATILRKWFGHLGEPFPRLLFQCLQMPIDQLQVASLHVLLALMRHKWAPERFCSLDGFLDFLLNREPHFTALGYQLKHQLICRLVDLQPAQIEPPTLQMLRQYVEQGPYAPPTKVDVATEKAN